MKQELEKILSLLSGDLSYDKRSEAKKIVKELLGQLEDESDAELKQEPELEQESKIYIVKPSFDPTPYKGLTKTISTMDHFPRRSKFSRFPGVPYTQEEKNAIISMALSSEEGRVSLAQSMVEPIRRSIDYQAVGRKLLLVDDLPQGATVRYESDKPSQF